MKRIISLKTITAAVLFFFSGHTLAQDNFTIKMTLKIDGMPPELAAASEMDILTYIKGDKLRTERNGMMGSTISVYDGKKMITLNDMMGNKSGFTATKAELEATDKDEKPEKPKIEYTTEKKTIAGYECTKVIVTYTGKDKKETKMTLWVTDKIKYSHPEAQKGSGRGMTDLSDLKGYPLSMEMSQNIMGADTKMTITATEINTAPIDESVFVLNTDGFTMVSYKEAQEQQKAMMKGR